MIEMEDESTSNTETVQDNALISKYNLPPRLAVQQNRCGVPKRGVKFEEFRETILSPSGRFLYYPVYFNQWNFVDLIHAKVTELYFRPGTDVFNMKRMKVFPMDDRSVLLLAKPVSKMSKIVYSEYSMATYELEVSDDPGSRTRLGTKLIKWTPILRVSQYEQKTFFRVKNKLYLLCTDRFRKNQLHYFDFEMNGKFFNNWKEFETEPIDDDLPLRKVREFILFQTIYDDHMYSFKKMNRLGSRFFDIHRFYEHYSKVCKQSIKTGIVEIVHLHDIRCMKIPECAYTPQTKFHVEGQWLGPRFYLHLTIREPTCRILQSHYFAYFDINFLEWKPINVLLPPYHQHCPLQMHITKDEVMVLMQFHSTPKRIINGVQIKVPHFCKEGAEICKLNIHRIPMRTPEPLKVLAQLAFNKLLENQTPKVRDEIIGKTKGAMIRPFYA
ncbi:hypothetical protein M3Y97_00997900 [Aphelenchoides bicaudatus]|nr:hypothetical protein M3Y97_00997900 [Aphelenchoides bicaudatus]